MNLAHSCILISVTVTRLTPE